MSQFPTQWYFRYRIYNVESYPNSAAIEAQLTLWGDLGWDIVNFQRTDSEIRVMYKKPKDFSDIEDTQL